jgi:hypothetical protein
MCDCYGHKCSVEGCEEYAPIHISDFIWSRDQYTGWCSKHLAGAPDEAVVFTLLADEDDGSDFPKGWRFALLGPAVGADATLNVMVDVGMMSKKALFHEIAAIRKLYPDNAREIYGDLADMVPADIEPIA